MPDNEGGPSPGALGPHAPDENAGRQSLIGAFIGRLGALARRWQGGSVRDSIEEILEEPEAGGDALAPEERHMLRNILEFGDLRVGDVMVPRADIIGVEVETPLADIVHVFKDAQHSRLPIYEETLDKPVGMLHIKDVIGLLVPGEAPKAFDIMKLKRDVLFVPATMPVVDLLLKMQHTRVHLALVIDEYGGTEGLVSIEDLIEQIVGDIDDEHDTDAEPVIAPMPEGGFDADARASVEALQKLLKRNLTRGIGDEESDTIAGLVTTLAGRVPKRGEVIEHPAGFLFEIADADPRRVKRVRVRKVKKAAAPKSQKAEASGA